MLYEYLVYYAHQKESDVILEDMSSLKLIYTSFNDTGECEVKFKIMQSEVQCVVSLYPKEWLINEIEGDPLLKHDLEDINTFEPTWKLIVSNKAILPLLWAKYPGHPNLLPAFMEDPKSLLGEEGFKKLDVKNWVSKPLYGREGDGVFFSSNFTDYD